MHQPAHDQPPSGSVARSAVVRRRSGVSLGPVVLVVLIAGAACSPTAPSGTDEGDPPARSELRVTSVSPAVGSTLLPTTLSIAGSGFVAGTTVSVDGQRVQATVVSSERIVATLAPRAPRVVEIVVSHPDGRSVRLADAFRFDANVLVDPVEVRLTGQVVEARGGAPVAGLEVMFLPTLKLSTGPVVTDAHGRFEAVGATEQNIRDISLWVERLGHTVGRKTVSRSSTGPVVVEVTGPIVIRAGESIDSALLLTDHPVWCSEIGDVRCVGVILEGSADELIDLTFSAVEGQAVGFFLETPLFPPSVFPQRLMVTPGTYWVIGGPSRFTVAARGH